MRLYLVTTHRAMQGPPAAIRQEAWPWTLLSYAHADVERFLSQAWTPESCILIDSGAFTAFCAGSALRPEDYAEWAGHFRRRWEGKVRLVEFMTLDVIGDQDATWRNYRALRILGLPVIPIVTYGVAMRHMDRALEESDRIALGGLVPLSQRSAELRCWLDACFSRVVAHREKTGRLAQVHLLGLSQRWVMEAYPAATVDSSAWAFLVRNGQWTGKAGLPARLPPISAQPLINQFALRRKIVEARELVARATAIWQARGVHFDD